MSEDELIEKTALAMADADNEGGDYGMTGADVMACERGREAYVKRARAALAAIREALQEPTDAMIDADEADLFNRLLQKAHDYRAENEALRVKQVGLVEALNRIEHEAVIRPKYRAVETVSDLRQIARAAIKEVNRE